MRQIDSTSDNDVGNGDGEEVGAPHFVCSTLDSVARGKADVARQIWFSRFPQIDRLSFFDGQGPKYLATLYRVLLFWQRWRCWGVVVGAVAAAGIS